MTAKKFARPFRGDAARLEAFKAFVRAYWEKHHYSPDNSEIADALGASTNTVSFWRSRLEHDGWLEKPTQSPRPGRSCVPVEIFSKRPVFPEYVRYTVTMDDDAIIPADVDKKLGEDCFGQTPLGKSPIEKVFSAVMLDETVTLFRESQGNPAGVSRDYKAKENTNE